MNKDEIYTYVGPTNFVNGLTYVQEGKVTEFTTGGDAISACVVGTDSYETWIGLENNHIVDSSCTCPVRSNICKHVAALAIYALAFQPKVWTFDKSGVVRSVPEKQGTIYFSTELEALRAANNYLFDLIATLDKQTAENINRIIELFAPDILKNN